MLELGTLAVALAGGAAGKAVGNSPITGPQPWGKVLGPLAAIVLPIVYKKFGGGDMTFEQAAQTGTLIGLTATGLYSAAKNAVQLVKSLLKPQKG